MSEQYYVLEEGKVTQGPFVHWEEADLALDPAFNKEDGRNSVRWKPLSGIAAVNPKDGTFSFITHNCSFFDDSLPVLKQAVQEMLGRNLSSGEPFFGDGGDSPCESESCSIKR